jgi:hypothetical protein
MPFESSGQLRQIFTVVGPQQMQSGQQGNLMQAEESDPQSSAARGEAVSHL